MNVLLIGSGGREHAIAWKLRQSPLLTDLHIAPGNGGTALEGHNLDLPIPKTGASVNEVTPYLEAVARAAKELNVDLVFVAPDDPLSWGLVDRLEAEGIAAFGPSGAAAQIEASKDWAKGFMARHGLPHPATATFDDAAAARDYVMSRPGAVVVKADGLSAGKGAIVTNTHEDAILAIQDILVGHSLGPAGNRMVIEDRISGREVSVHAFSDGSTFRSMPLSCDHKAVFDGNVGPNTGGMGVFSPPGWLEKSLEEWIETQVTAKTVAGMAAEGRPYRGVLYPQVMVTESGPQMIEFNARFGDPETQALLVRMESDLLETAWACVNGSLDAVEVRWDAGASVCVVLASGGYPGAYATGFPIGGLDSLDEGVFAFHAGTRREGDLVLTNGGRVLGITATGRDLEIARARAYANVERIYFEGMHYRRDIGAN